MEFSILFIGYSIALFVLGIRMLSRRAFALTPLKIYPWVVVPLILMLVVGIFKFSDTFFLLISLCLDLFILIPFLIFFLLLRRYANGPVIFNCEKKRVIELLSQILQEQGIAFSQERTVFSINQGQSTLELSGYSNYPSRVNIKGDRSVFQPVLQQLQIVLKDEKSTKYSPVTFLVIFYSIFMLGQVINFAFPKALQIDLSGYGEIIRQIGELGASGFYIGGTIIALGLIGCAILCFIPKPLILMKTSTGQWGMAILFLFSMMFFVLTLVNYSLYLLILFYVIGFNIILVFMTKTAPTFYGIVNVNTAGVDITNNLREILNQQQIEFQEVNNEFHLKSGAVLEVQSSPMKQNSVGMTIVGRNLEPKLPMVEKLFLNDVKKLPGKASVLVGLILLGLGLLQLAYFMSPFLLSRFIFQSLLPTR